MPLTAKGSKILATMQEQYGETKGKQIFYASKNKGTISGVDSYAHDEEKFDVDYEPNALQRVYSTEELGEHQYFTPEGFLCCYDVPIARLGEMLYADGETEVEPGPDGIVHIYRGEDVVFSPDTIMSFVGKPVTDDHPPEDVLPENWRKYAGGHVTNIRRGRGKDKDLLLADLLITDPELIEAIRSKKRTQVSAGYDADYEQDRPGFGRQVKIIGNHVAIVENGRCGPQCSIRDSAMNKHVRPKKTTFFDRMRALMKDYENDFMGGKKDREDKEDDYGNYEKSDFAEDDMEEESGKKYLPENQGGSEGTHHHVTVNIGGVPTDISKGGDQDPNIGGYGNMQDPNQKPVKAGVGGTIGSDQVPSEEQGSGDPVQQIMEAIKSLEMRIAALEGGNSQHDELPKEFAEQQENINKNLTDVTSSQGDELPKMLEKAQSNIGKEYVDVAKDTAYKNMHDMKYAKDMSYKNMHDMKYAKDMSYKNMHDMKYGNMKNDTVHDMYEEGGLENVSLDELPKEFAEQQENIKKELVDQTGDMKMHDTAMRDAAVIQVERTLFQETIAMGDILAPGISIPTYDFKLGAKRTADTLCLFRKRALAKAWSTDRGRETIKPFLPFGAKTFGSLTCDATAVLFQAAVSAAKTRNGISPNRLLNVSKQSAVTPADINKMNAEYWKKGK